MNTITSLDCHDGSRRYKIYTTEGIFEVEIDTRPSSVNHYGIDLEVNDTFYENITYSKYKVVSYIDKYNYKTLAIIFYNGPVEMVRVYAYAELSNYKYDIHNAYITINNHVIEHADL